MRKSKQNSSERERRLRHNPSAPMSQNDPKKNPTPEQRLESEKFRNQGLNEDEQKKAANYIEDNAQSHRGPSPRNASNSETAEKRENGQVEDTNDQRLEADDDKDDIN